MSGKQHLSNKLSRWRLNISFYCCFLQIIWPFQEVGSNIYRQEKKKEMSQRNARKQLNNNLILHNLRFLCRFKSYCRLTEPLNAAQSWISLKYFWQYARGWTAYVRHPFTTFMETANLSIIPTQNKIFKSWKTSEIIIQIYISIFCRSHRIVSIRAQSSKTYYAALEKKTNTHPQCRVYEMKWTKQAKCLSLI